MSTQRASLCGRMHVLLLKVSTSWESQCLLNVHHCVKGCTVAQCVNIHCVNIVNIIIVIFQLISIYLVLLSIEWCVLHLAMGLSLMCSAKFTVSPYLCEIEILSPHSFYGHPTATELHSVRRQGTDKSSKVSDVDAHSCRHTDHCLQSNVLPLLSTRLF